MNKYKAEGSVFIAEAWVPQIYLKEMNDIVEFKIHTQMGSNKLVPGEMKVLTMGWDEPGKLELSPPTYFRQNEWTVFTQMITDTYGVPRYKEINPTLFNCVTFPFQFGVMFGDIFHGTFMFIISVVVFLADPYLKVGSFKWFFLQMGFWAMFMGYIYNDFTGLSIDLFGTCYTLQGEE
jgi:V-type H+-transporting ATPase subunit a